MKKKYKALGYHIYAGGFTVGVSKHFDVLAHLEHSNYGVATTRLNFPKLPVFTSQVQWPRKFEQIDLLYGNPPCAAFSVVGKHLGETDIRLTYHRQFQQLIKLHQPTVAVCESVCGLLTKGAELVEEFMNLPGYAFYVVQHNAKYHGVPQDRKRVFLVASKVRLDFWSDKLTEPITAQEALKGIKNTDKITNLYSYRYAKLFNHVIPGELLTKTFDRLNRKVKTDEYGRIQNRPPFTMTCLKADKVSGTVMRAKLHWNCKRFININEFKALCTFPQDYRFHTRSYESSIVMMSKGVSPKVGEWLARVVLHGLKRNQTPVKLVEHLNIKPKSI